MATPVIGFVRVAGIGVAMGSCGRRHSPRRHGHAHGAGAEGTRPARGHGTRPETGRTAGIVRPVMRRRLLTLAAAISLVLCAVATGLWVRSYSGSDAVSRRWMTAADEHHTEHRSQEIQWTLGQVRFVLRHDTAYFPVRMKSDAAEPQWSYIRYGEGHAGWDVPPAAGLWNRLGFAAWETGWSSSFADSSDRVWAAPAWLLVVTSAILPAAWALGAYRRRRRRQAGLCTNCGYDLRASGERCPECGSVNLPRRDGKVIALEKPLAIAAVHYPPGFTIETFRLIKSLISAKQPAYSEYVPPTTWAVFFQPDAIATAESLVAAVHELRDRDTRFAPIGAAARVGVVIYEADTHGRIRTCPLGDEVNLVLRAARADAATNHESLG
jgi:hypothetical protein